MRTEGGAAKVEVKGVKAAVGVVNILVDRQILGVISTGRAPVSGLVRGANNCLVVFLTAVLRENWYRTDETQRAT